MYISVPMQTEGKHTNQHSRYDMFVCVCVCVGKRERERERENERERLVLLYLSLTNLRKNKFN